MDAGIVQSRFEIFPADIQGCARMLRNNLRGVFALREKSPTFAIPNGGRD